MAETADAVLRAVGTRRSRGGGLALRGTESYQAGRYAVAAPLAEAEKVVERSKGPFPSLAVLVGAAAFAAVSMSLFLYARVRRRPVEGPRDLEKLFRQKPWLNPDQRKAVEFLAARKGRAFESEIREAMDQPKTTIWRMVKKLEQEGIVTVEQLVGRNYVMLRPR